MRLLFAIFVEAWSLTLKTLVVDVDKLVISCYCGLVIFCHCNLVISSYCRQVIFCYYRMVIPSYYGLVISSYCGVEIFYYYGLVISCYYWLVISSYFGLVISCCGGMVISCYCGLVISCYCWSFCYFLLVTLYLHSPLRSSLVMYMSVFYHFVDQDLPTIDIFNHLKSQKLNIALKIIIFTSTFHISTIQHYVIKFVSDLWQVGGFILHQENWLPRYNWNIVESGTKHHKSKINPFISAYKFHRQQDIHTICL